MTEVTHTPPALRWVALFLAACAVLGLFLGFRDQIRKNPPGWYTGAEQVASPLPTTADGAREAVAFDPNAPQAKGEVNAAPAPTAPARTEDAAEDEPDEAAPAETVTTPTVVPTTQTAQPAAPAPKPKAAAPPPPSKAPARPAPQADPVGDILEGQKQPETPATVPY